MSGRAATSTIAIISIVLVFAFGIVESQGTAYCEGDCDGVLQETNSSSERGDIEAQQAGDLSSYTLNVTGLVQNATQHTLAEVFGNNPIYTRNATLKCVGGWTLNASWEGVLVSDLIAEAVALPNATIAIFHASDGFTTSLPLSYLYNRGIILAYQANGAPIAGIPPVQLEAEDKWGYKWARWVTDIELSADTDYRGYYESFGYSNTANLNQSFVEFPGDVTGDYIVNAADITKIERIILGLDSVVAVGTDANDDGVVNASDIGVIEYMILGIWPWNHVHIEAPGNIASGTDFTAGVYITYIENLGTARLEMTFNQSVLQVQGVTSGRIHEIDPGVSAEFHPFSVSGWNSSVPGRLQIDGSTDGGGNVSGSGYLAKVHFQVIGSAGGASPIAFDVPRSWLSDAAAGDISVTWGNDSVTVAP
jgi:hypothetical protein